MRKNAFLLALLSLALVLTAPACRPKKVIPPTTVPAEVATTPPTTEPATPVETPDKDFKPVPAERDPLSEDIAEVNRVARERGWIHDVFFGYDASTLDADAQQAVEQSATWLRAHPEFGLLVEGHCDERGTEQYNLALGDRRAETVVAQLAVLGVDRGRIKTVSYGEERPFEEGSTEAARAQNRRGHLVLTRQ
jgi:peptidoglycan-associated lipoprotein